MIQDERNKDFLHQSHPRMIAIWCKVFCDQGNNKIFVQMNVIRTVSVCRINGDCCEMVEDDSCVVWRGMVTPVETSDQ